MRCFMIRFLPAAVVVGMLQLGMVVPGAKAAGGRLFAVVPSQ